MQYTCSDGGWNFSQISHQGGHIVGFHIHHNVANFTLGTQVLRSNIDLVAKKYMVNIFKNTRFIAVNMHDAACKPVVRQRYLREIDC